MLKKWIRPWIYPDLKIHYKSPVGFYLKTYLMSLVQRRKTFVYIQKRKMKIDNHSFRDTN